MGSQLSINTATPQSQGVVEEMEHPHPMAFVAANRGLTEGFSLEITAADLEALRSSAASIPSGTQINITYLGTEATEMRVSAARAVRELGFSPVPHISARRLGSEDVLDLFLNELAQGTVTKGNVFAVAGDAKEIAGPYDDALAIIRSPLLRRHGVSRVSIAGYPEGHPYITEESLWTSMTKKTNILTEQGLAGDIISQFAFDADAVIEWISAVRDRGIDLPIRVGVPGPTGVRRLLAYAKRCGVGTSTTIVQKYGFSLTNLLSTAGPDRFIAALGQAYDPTSHGTVRLHFYAFGGVERTAEWINDGLQIHNDKSPSIQR